MDKYTLPKDILQNLQDAGCKPEMIECFAKSDDKERQIRILASQRKQLLEEYHILNEKLTCLDYLIYNLRKNIEE